MIFCAGQLLEKNCVFLIPLTSFRLQDLDFADDAVIFAETIEVLVAYLNELSKESESLGLRVSWVKTKLQNFIKTVDQARSVSCCGEEVGIDNVFPYLGC